MPLIGRVKLDQVIDDAVEDLNNKLIAIYTKGLTDIVQATPVHYDQGGRLRNSWMLTYQHPSKQTRGKNRTGRTAINHISSSMPKSVLGKSVYFTNNLPYANVVEYGGYPSPPKDGTWTGQKFEKLSSGGYSKQAPSGMVRINVSKMTARIKAL